MTDKGGISLSPLPKAVGTLKQPPVAHVELATAVEVPEPTPAPVITYTSTGGATNCGSDPYLAQIYQMESGCCPTKWQGEHICPDTYEALHDPSDGWIGYGLCQSTPAIKMSSAGDWQTNWDVQNSWCTNYAVARYGSTANAWAYWQIHRNW